MYRLSNLINISTNYTKTLTNLKRFNEKLNKKVEGTFIERRLNYLKAVYRDYKDVVINVRQDIRDKPIKSTFLFIGLGIFGVSLKTNPTEQQFYGKFIECTNQVNLVHSNLVNPEIVEHLKFVQRCYNQNLVRHQSFGFFSIIWIDKYSNECNIYETNCTYLQPKFYEYTNRIVDIGFWNIWWVISRKMLDYDINY